MGNREEYVREGRADGSAEVPDSDTEHMGQQELDVEVANG